MIGLIEVKTSFRPDTSTVFIGSNESFFDHAIPKCGLGLWIFNCVLIYISKHSHQRLVKCERAPAPDDVLSWELGLGGRLLERDSGDAEDRRASDVILVLLDEDTGNGSTVVRAICFVSDDFDVFSADASDVGLEALVHEGRYLDYRGVNLAVLVGKVRGLEHPSDLCLVTLGAATHHESCQELVMVLVPTRDGDYSLVVSQTTCVAKPALFLRENRRARN